jgi:hypothetical protein
VRAGLATDKTRKDLGFRFRLLVLSGRESRSHRLAAVGGRQVSAAFMSFMIFMSFMSSLLLASERGPKRFRRRTARGLLLRMLLQVRAHERALHDQGEALGARGVDSGLRQQIAEMPSPQ